MLQIIILAMLAVNIGKIVEKKGRKKIGYQLMVIGMWIGGEVLGMILGVVIAAIADVDDGAGILFFVLALGGAITGAVIAFRIAHNAPPAERGEELYRGIEYADRLRAREHFGDRNTTDPTPDDAYTDNPEKVRRPRDDRIQE